MTFWVGRSAMNEETAKLVEYLKSIVGDEARSLVEVHDIRKAAPQEHMVKAQKESLGGLGGHHGDIQGVASAVIQEEQRHAALASSPSPKMLAVAEHHHMRFG